MLFLFLSPLYQIYLTHSSYNIISYVTYVQSDGHMSKRFALWRLPPVLVVHLKRFQFDQTSRRKLTNKVDFPLEGLDLSRYLADTRWDHLKPSLRKTKKIMRDKKQKVEIDDENCC